MHKDAGDLKPGDCFLMAGGAYEIEQVYELDDEDYVEFSFSAIEGFWKGGRLKVRKDILFTTL